MIQFVNFHVGYKNYIGFAVAKWETVYPAPYFKDSKRTGMNDPCFDEH